MRYLFLVLLLSGCTANSFLSDIPNAEFKRFEYHRGGNITSTHIIADRGRLVNGALEVENINVNTDYGPVFNLNIKLEGYRRSVE